MKKHMLMLTLLVSGIAQIDAVGNNGGGVRQFNADIALATLKNYVANNYQAVGQLLQNSSCPNPDNRGMKGAYAIQFPKSHTFTSFINNDDYAVLLKAVLTYGGFTLSNEKTNDQMAEYVIRTVFPETHKMTIMPIIGGNPATWTPTTPTTGTVVTQKGNYPQTPQGNYTRPTFPN